MQNDIEKITTNWPKNASVYITKQPLKNYMVHAHTFYEIEFAQSGSVRHVVNGKTGIFQTGDIWFLSPATVHHFYTDPDHPGVDRYLLYFDPDYISEAVRKALQVQTLPFCVHLEGDAFIAMSHLFQVLNSHAKAHLLPHTEFIRCSLECILLHLNEQHLSSLLDNGLSRLQPALIYIQSHFRTDLTIREVADTVYMSVPYFSKLFHKQLGMSYREYVLNLRLTYAHAMLYGPDYRVQEICFRAGFHTPEYFSRAFKKKYGISPERHHLNNLLPK